MNATTDDRLPGIVHRFGDVCAAEHGGGVLVRSEDGYLTLEYSHGVEAENPYARYTDDEAEELTVSLYRVAIPAGENGALTDTEAIRSDLDWIGDDWEWILGSLGLGPWDLFAIALDPDRAWCLYEIVASYWGWGELDHYPERVTYGELEARWA